MSSSSCFYCAATDSISKCEDCHLVGFCPQHQSDHRQAVTSEANNKTCRPFKVGSTKISFHALTRAALATVSYHLKCFVDTRYNTDYQEYSDSNMVNVLTVWFLYFCDVGYCLFIIFIKTNMTNKVHICLLRSYYLYTFVVTTNCIVR